MLRSHWMDNLIPSCAYPHYPCPFARAVFHLGSSSSSSRLSSHPPSSPELLQSSCSPLGAPTVPCCTFPHSALNTRICNCNRGRLQLEGQLDGGAHSPDGTFPLLPTLLAEPPFCSADPLLPGPGSEGASAPGRWSLFDLHSSLTPLPSPMLLLRSDHVI